MLSSALPGPVLTLLALASLSLSTLPQCATPDSGSVTVGICGQAGAIEIPLDGSSPGPKQDCATACHALCDRRKCLAPGDG